MSSIKRGLLQRIRRLIGRAGYDIYPNIDYFISDQVKLIAGERSPTVFDVGANEGKFARAYREFLPEARLFCVEPIPHLADQIRKTLQGVQVIERAIAKEDGNANFYVNEFEDTSSLLPSDLERLSESYRSLMTSKKILEVLTSSIDSIMTQLEINHIDILKMDIQGGEYDALQGAEKALSEGRITLIASEVFFTPYYSEQRLFGDIAFLLSKHNYQLYNIYNMKHDGVTGRPQWADAIFMRRNG